MISTLFILSALLTACPILLTLSAPLHQIPLSAAPFGQISTELFKELEGLAEVVELCSDDGSAKLRHRDAPLKDLDVVHRWDGLGIRVCIAADHDDGDGRGDMYVVFDGEYGHVDALVDMAVPLPFRAAGGGLVHGGFQNTWEAVGGNVLGRAGRPRGGCRKYGLNILGRGAGGSVAALAALNFTLRGWEPKLTTFGQPKFGDADFMKFFDEHIPSERYRRVTHITDPVPILEFSELGLVHTNEEYFIHKPFPPYLPSDVRVCALGSQDPICSAHRRTSPFDLPFAQSPYLASGPTAPTDIDVSHDFSVELVELEILPLEILPFPRDPGFSSPEPLPTISPPSPFISLPNSSPLPSPNLNKRNLDKALEYFHLPKDQLKASLAEAAAAHEPPPPPSKDPNDPDHAPSDNPEDLDKDDDKDLITQASSIIVYNGKPIEMDGRPALSRRGLLSDKKARFGHRKKGGPGLGLALESTTPAYTLSKPKALERTANNNMGGKPSKNEVLDAQKKKGQNFPAFNLIPPQKDANIRYTNGVGGGKVEQEKRAPVKVQDGKKKEKKVKRKRVKNVDDNKAMRLLDKRGRITYGWGEWEPQMQYLESLNGPAVMGVAYEDALDSGAWAGEAPNELAKDRFWRDSILS